MESVLNLLREDGVTHVGCATDHVIRSWRNDRYAGYKTEAGMPPELLAQFGLVEDALRALGLVVWAMVEFEADDAIGAAAARFADDPAVERVVILSPDKDMAQCVREDGRVVSLRPAPRPAHRRGRGAREVRRLPGQHPRLPGPRRRQRRRLSRPAGLGGRVGRRRAAPATATSRTIPTPGLAVGPGRARRRRRWRRCCGTRQADAFLFRELARLRLDAPVPQTLDDLRWHGVPRPAFEALVDRLGARHLFGRVPRWAA